MKTTLKLLTAGEAGGTPVAAPQVILVPTDFSRPARKALQYAVNFARTGNARIVLLHVLSPQQAPGWRFDYASGTWRLAAPHPDAVEQRLTHLAGEVVPPGIRVTTLVRFGFPSNVILEVAAQTEANLIVLATHAHVWLAHVLLGSVAARVGRLAPCPVFVVREHGQEWQSVPPALLSRRV